MRSPMKMKMKLLFSSFIKNPKNVCFEGEDADEKILLTLRRHPITNLKWISIFIVLLITPLALGKILTLNGLAGFSFLPISYRFVLFSFWYLISFGYLFTHFLIWFYSVYLVSNKRVIDIDFHGLLHRRFSEALLINIEDLTHSISGMAQVLFHYGTVHMQTAGELRELEFESVPKPGEVQDFISDLAEEATKMGGHAHVD